ncbi:MAG: hypothetical protein RL097_601 [Candidatus Parcubacteria bacterium]|jgi:F0F1-type ATP synthase delta subunit
MKTEYVQALLQTLHEGVATEVALSGLRRVLEKNKHSKLLPAILQEAVRMLETEKGASFATVAVARSADNVVLATQIKNALAELQVPSTAIVKIVIDETLVGGFVATFDYKERDQSYKKVLTSLYESITK